MEGTPSLGFCVKPIFRGLGIPRKLPSIEHRRWTPRKGTCWKNRPLPLNRFNRHNTKEKIFPGWSEVGEAGKDVEEMIGKELERVENARDLGVLKVRSEAPDQ